ncbi:carbon-nitrogen hydrolase [Cadophora sp. DSE1049]|nr:carbon-nitrogen hydrolase [Cadophora sp. DSE1049]
MRIACLQFAPQVGDVDNNLNRADAVLSKANPQNIDLLVLPELAFSGESGNRKGIPYHSIPLDVLCDISDTRLIFLSQYRMQAAAPYLRDEQGRSEVLNLPGSCRTVPYLEPTTAGITSLWARTTALKYDCVVTAGYPEKVDITPKWPASPEYYNSAITVNAEGETIANYRKSFLYYTDETWALEGPDGFYDGEIDGLGNVAMGICMDLNPYKFEAPWSAWEFAYHILHKEANLVIISMAWLTREDARSFSRTPKEPDMETLSYWLARMEPLIRAESDDEIIVVLANRCGTEDDAVYAGTSAVLGIQSGEVKVYGILGRGERELLVVDTTRPPQAKLISEPKSAGSKRQSIGSNHSANQTLSSKAAKPFKTAKPISSPNLSVSIGTPSARSLSSSPPTPDAMDLTMDDIIAPLSPVDARAPNSFFSRPGDVDSDPRRASRGSLKSSTDRVKQADAAKPDSPTFYQHPPSPKSRNSSRNRQPNYVDPSLISPELGQEPEAGPRTFGVGTPLIVTKPPPHSASAIPDRYEENFSSKSAGLRSPVGSPRPKSVTW